MRHAISIAAAASGTVLLALALFGEPATYLREARSGWQSTPANDVMPSYTTLSDTPPPDTPPPDTPPPNAAQPGTTLPATAPSAATPSPPAGERGTANDATMVRMNALQTEVTKLREALAERGQGGTGDVPDRKDTDRQHGESDNAAHQETANPPPTVPTPDKGNQDSLVQAAPRTVPQAVASRASSPVASSSATAVAPAPPPATTPPVTTPPAVAPPVAAPSAAAAVPAAEPRIAERASEPPKTATLDRPNTRIAELMEPPKAGPDLPGPGPATRSEPPRVVAPNPPDTHAAERVSPPEPFSRARRRTQAADRTDTRDTTPRRTDAGTNDGGTNKAASRMAVVTPPTPPRAVPPAGNPPIQAVPPSPPPVAAASPRRDAGRPPVPKDEQDADTVLARLRQAMLPPPPGAPTPEPIRLADATQAVPRPSEASASPRSANGTGSGTGAIVGRLRAARADLTSGRIEAARRELQQAQLSLVFRPAGEEVNADAISAGSAGVGKALSALGQNDVRASLGFVDRATADLLHGGAGNAQAPLLQNEVAGGYAPAYPPR